jgi:hypothetical protein
MASAFDRIKKFAKSPEGKKLEQELKEQAAKPENKQKIKDLGRRFKRR